LNIYNDKSHNKNTGIFSQKIKEKPPPSYSTLKPETSSNSPSAKYKGVRLVSAKQEINQTKYKGREKKINHK
jgi:hypothetical protein